MKYMSLLPQDKVAEAFFEAFPTAGWCDILQSPETPISFEDIITLREAWNTVDRQIFHYMLRDKLYGTAFGSENLPPSIIFPKYHASEHYHTFPDGQVASKVILPLKGMEILSFRPSPLIKTDETKLNELLQRIQKNNHQFGTPKSANIRTSQNVKAQNVKAENMMKLALLRLITERAIRGGITNAVLRGVFDIKLLFDGEFKKYCASIGISGLYGASVSGLSKWVRHPIFGNGMVLGVLIGGAFNAFSLFDTGDWARFGKSLGMSVVGTAAAWGGGTAGVALGAAIGGPLGWLTGPIFGIAGSFLAANYGTQAASKYTPLGGHTSHEFAKGYENIKKQLTAAGLEPDPDMSPEQFVTAMFSREAANYIRVKPAKAMVDAWTDTHSSLKTMRGISEEGFAKFVDKMCSFAESQDEHSHPKDG